MNDITLKEFIQTVLEKEIPMDSRGSFSLEIVKEIPTTEKAIVKRTSTERMTVLRQLAEQNKNLPVLPAEVLTRESLYDDRI